MPGGRITWRCMGEFEAQFEQSLAFEPEGDFEAFIKAVPAKWAVYLMCDGADRPVQLLCVKNLRYSLERRLGTAEADAGPSEARELSARWCEGFIGGGWTARLRPMRCIWSARRRVFPETYRGMVGFRPAWFVQVDPQAALPRYSKTIDLLGGSGLLLGPVEDKHAARRLIELAEDVFEPVPGGFLRAADGGAARAGVRVQGDGRCPAPCDGSISMDEYRQMIEQSVTALVEPEPFIPRQTRQMKQAAGELRFEDAAHIKGRVEQLAQLGKGAFRHLRRLSDGAFLSFQRGGRAGQAKVFLITPGRIEQIAVLLEEPEHPGGSAAHGACAPPAAARRSAGPGGCGAHRRGRRIICFRPSTSRGRFCRWRRLTRRLSSKPTGTCARSRRNRPPAREWSRSFRRECRIIAARDAPDGGGR